MEKRGDFPEPAITGRASVEMLMPPGIAAQEGPGHVVRPGSNSSQRGKDRFASAGSLDLERAQHARRITAEPGPALNNVRQGIGGHRVAQLRSRSDNAFELLPAAGSRDGLFQRRAVPFCLEQRRSKGPEGGQSIAQYCPRILNARIAAPLRTPEGLADDPVMGLDYGIGDSAAPLHSTDGTDSETAITRNVAQPVGEVALPLAAKTGNAMRRNGLQQIGGKIEALQEFQAIEKAVNVSRVLAHLEPAQPDEPAHAAVDFLGKQPVASSRSRRRRMASSKPAAMRVSIRRSAATSASAQRRSRTDNPGRITCRRRHSSTNRRASPSFERAASASFSSQTFRSRAQRPERRNIGEHPVAVAAPDLGQVFPPGLLPHRIAIEVFGAPAKLCGNEAKDVPGNGLPRHQKPPRISKGAKLEREAQPVVPPAPHPDLLDVVVGQRVMAQPVVPTPRQTGASSVSQEHLI